MKSALVTDGLLLNMRNREPIARWPLLALVCLALLILPRWSLPLLDPEETRYAEIPREMLHHHQWLVPLYEGQPYFDKPPLLYWLVMISYQLFGINTIAARLPANLIALCMVALAYLWGKRQRNQKYGLVAAGMLILMPAFDHYSAMLTMNGLLALCVTAALLFGHSALQGELLSKGLWCLSAVATGFGLLAKGPVAVVLIGLPLFILPWFSRDLIKPRWKAILGYLALAAIVAAPWYTLMFWEVPDFGSYFFFKHHLERFANPFDHPEPFWYYIPLVIAGTLPWTGIALSGLLSKVLSAKCFVSSPNSFTLSTQDSALSTKRFNLSESGYLLASALWMLVFFSAAGSKRMMYLVPVYPVLSLALAGYLGDLLASKKKALGMNTPTWRFVAGVMAVGLMTWSWLILPGYHRRFSVDEVVAQSARSENLLNEPVFFYPHPFSGVSFLLDLDDAHSFGLGQVEVLYQALEKELQGIIFIKPTLADKFCHGLPNSLDYAVLGHNSRVSAILVTNKQERSAAAQR